METPSRGPIIIEFNGLPGCGKSTTVRALKDKLNSTQTTSISSFYKSPWYKNKFVQLFWYKNIGLLICLLRLAAKQKDFYAALPGVLAICRYNQMYHMYAKNGMEALLIDQGIIQGFLSMFHTNLIVKPYLIERISGFLNLKDLRFVIVNCDISVEESLCRIQNRQTRGGRLDNMNSVDLLRALKVQDTNLRTIRGCISKTLQIESISISTHDSIEDNVEKILRLYDEL